MAFEQLKFESFLTTAAVLILTGLLFYIWNKNRRLPPGPWGLPFIGYYPYISNQPYKVLYKLSKKYGNVISFRTLGGNLVIVLNDTKTIKEIFVNRADEFIGRPHGNNLVTWVSEGLGIAQEEGAPWKEQRRFFLHNLKNFGVEKAQIETLVIDEIQSMLQDLRKTEGKPIELLPHLAYLAHSVISEVLFSKKFEKNDPKWLAIRQGTHAMAEVFAGNKFLLVGWAFEPIFKVLMELVLCLRIHKMSLVEQSVIKCFAQGDKFPSEDGAMIRVSDAASDISFRGVTISL
ncbi:cytochrome P450 18a1-like, partial [Stegodyphus dumicola]|uniref:cytochrome P450 18a1-like n=1 Tax=Stegodyphus dumicola TaxID=202533 RepID=UPI0015AB6979